MSTGVRLNKLADQLALMLCPRCGCRVTVGKPKITLSDDAQRRQKLLRLMHDIRERALAKATSKQRQALAEVEQRVAELWQAISE